MRLTIRLVSAALAASLLAPAATLAAAAKLTPAQRLEARDRAKNPRSFDRCVELAKQRGESINELDYRDRARAFVRGCMKGKYH
jgi:Spy/CpxP family protein refolding chaperone